MRIKNKAVGEINPLQQIPVFGQDKGPFGIAASMCNHILYFEQMRAISSTGSTAVEPVCSIAATTQTGLSPF